MTATEKTSVRRSSWILSSDLPICNVLHEFLHQFGVAPETGSPVSRFYQESQLNWRLCNGLHNIFQTPFPICDVRFAIGFASFRKSQVENRKSQLHPSRTYARMRAHPHPRTRHAQSPRGIHFRFAICDVRFAIGFTRCDWKLRTSDKQRSVTKMRRKATEAKSPPWLSVTVMVGTLRTRSPCG